MSVGQRSGGMCLDPVASARLTECLFLDFFVGVVVVVTYIIGTRFYRRGTRFRGVGAGRYQIVVAVVEFLIVEFYLISDTFYSDLLPLNFDRGITSLPH